MKLNFKHYGLTMFNSSEFLTIKEVAIIFSVHPNTIRQAIKKGWLIAIRLSNKKRSPYRISRKEIDLIHNKSIKHLENIR